MKGTLKIKFLNNKNMFKFKYRDFFIRCLFFNEDNKKITEKTPIVQSWGNHTFDKQISM